MHSNSISNKFSTDHKQESFELNGLQLVIGIFFFIAGILVYIVDRPGTSGYFLENFQPLRSFFDTFTFSFGLFEGFAFDYFHPLSFSLLCMAFVSAKKEYVIICIFWFFVNTVFEISQLLRWELPALLLQRDSSGRSIFILTGTFDPFDMVAIGLGSILAYVIGNLTTKTNSR
jgi:hypothetical protein